jgi:hypothetical protein
MVEEVGTASIDAPASRRSLAAVCLRTGNPVGLRPASRACPGSVETVSPRPEISCPQADHLGPSSSGEDEDQQDRSIPSAPHNLGHHGERPAHLICAVSRATEGDGPWALEGASCVSGCAHRLLRCPGKQHDAGIVEQGDGPRLRALRPRAARACPQSQRRVHIR